MKLSAWLLLLMASWLALAVPLRAAPVHLGGAEADPAAASVAGDAHKPDPLSFKADLAIWTLVVFVVLFVVLYKFAWGPISDGLDKRESGILAEIAAAQRTNEQAKALLADYESRLAKSHDEVRGILEEARRDAEHTQQHILTKARADAEAEVARGKREIEMATSQALTELARTSTNLAVDLAGKIVKAQLRPADHARLIDEALASFPKGDPRSN